LCRISPSTPPSAPLALRAISAAWLCEYCSPSVASDTVAVHAGCPDLFLVCGWLGAATPLSHIAVIVCSTLSVCISSLSIIASQLRRRKCAYLGTFVMPLTWDPVCCRPCNNSGYTDPSTTLGWSVVDFDWSNGKVREQYLCGYQVVSENTPHSKTRAPARRMAGRSTSRWMMRKCYLSR